VKLVSVTSSALINLGSKFLTIAINQIVWSRKASGSGVGLLAAMLVTSIFYRQVSAPRATLKLCDGRSDHLTVCTWGAGIAPPGN